MTVALDKDVLAATVVALDDLAHTLPALLGRAASLGVRGEMAGLLGAEQWSADTARDMRARIGILEQIEQGVPQLAGRTVPSDTLRALAAQPVPIEDAVLALRVTSTSPDAWPDDPANVKEWIEQLQARAVQRLAGLDDARQGELLVGAYHDLQDLVVSSTAAVAAFVQLRSKAGPALARWVAEHRIVQPGLDALARAGHTRTANWLSSAIGVADDLYLNARVQFTRPGAFVPNLAEKALLRAASVVEGFDDWVARMSSATKPYLVDGRPQSTLVAKALTSRPGVAATSWVSTMLSTARGGQLATTAARWGNNVFGRPWTNPATGISYGRNAGNLLTMARTSGVVTMASSAGGLRVLGAAGSGFMTVDGAIGLVNNREELAATWEEGTRESRAQVVGQYAEVAFNASMTAALVAPNPVTLGAVAVTGIVWGGAWVVEHWDDITEATAKAADWVGDRAEDAGEWVGDRVDDLRQSDLNPMNWF